MRLNEFLNYLRHNGVNVTLNGNTYHANFNGRNATFHAPHGTVHTKMNDGIIQSVCNNLGINSPV